MKSGHHPREKTLLGTLSIQSSVIRPSFPTGALSCKNALWPSGFSRLSPTGHVPLAALLWASLSSALCWVREWVPTLPWQCGGLPGTCATTVWLWPCCAHRAQADIIGGGWGFTPCPAAHQFIPGKSLWSWAALLFVVFEVTSTSPLKGPNMSFTGQWWLFWHLSCWRGQRRPWLPEAQVLAGKAHVWNQPSTWADFHMWELPWGKEGKGGAGAHWGGGGHSWWPWEDDIWRPLIMQKSADFH